MKKSLAFFSLMLLCQNIFAQLGQISSIKFDIYNSLFGWTYTHGECGMYNRPIIPTGTQPQTIFGYEWRGVSGVPGAANEGPNNMSKLPLVLSAIYSPTGGWHKLQDGFTIKYPFRQGRQYDVKLRVRFSDIDPNYGAHFATLQLQLLNNPDYTYGRNCFLDAQNTYNPLYNLLSSPTNPAGDFMGNTFNEYYPVFSFTPTNDYAYIWFNAKTNEGYQNYGGVKIYDITINENELPIATGTFAGIPNAYVDNQLNYTYSRPINGTKIRMSNTPILYVSQAIYSPDQKTSLTLQGDGNVVLYHKNANGSQTALWASNTMGANADHVSLQEDVNLVLVSKTNTPIWASNLYNGYSFINAQSTVDNYPFYYLQNDGNLVCYWPSVDANGRECYIIFASTDTGGFVRSPHQGNLIRPATTNTLLGHSFKRGTAH